MFTKVIAIFAAAVAVANAGIHSVAPVVAPAAYVAPAVASAAYVAPAVAPAAYVAPAAVASAAYIAPYASSYSAHAVNHAVAAPVVTAPYVAAKRTNSISISNTNKLSGEDVIWKSYHETIKGLRASIDLIYCTNPAPDVMSLLRMRFVIALSLTTLTLEVILVIIGFLFGAHGFYRF